SLSLFNSRLAAFLSTIILATSWGYFWTAHEASNAMLFLFLLQLVCWFFYWWYQTAARPKLFSWDKQFLSLGLGTILGLLFIGKGPMGLLLPVFLIISFLFATGSVQRLFSLDWKRFGLSFLIISLPWPLWVSIQQGQATFWLEYWFKFPWSHPGFGANVSYFGSLLNGLLLWLFPWNCFLLGGLIDPKGLRKSFHKNREAMIFLLLWVIMGFAFGLIFNEQGLSAILPLYMPIILFVGFYLSKILEGLGDSPTYQLATDGVIFVLFGLAIFSTYFIFQFLPDEYPGSLWGLPGPAVIHKILIPLKEGAPFYSTLSHLPFFNKDILLPNLFPVWKLWLLPGPFILIISGVIIYLLSKTDRSQEIPVTLLGISVISLVFLSYIIIPIMSRPLSQEMASLINHQISLTREEKPLKTITTTPKKPIPQDSCLVVVDPRYEPQLLRLPFFLSPPQQNSQPTSAVQQGCPQFVFVEDPKSIETLLNSSSEHYKVFAILDENHYFDLPESLRHHLRVMANHWKWCSAEKDASTCWWPDKKHQGDFNQMTDEILLVEVLGQLIESTLPQEILPTHSIPLKQASPGTPQKP
ncbi:MAG: hypothetical protein K2X66_00010, partial [Cyanobacteria bacterium]|nr:hypothetical protein [Cyanobacteriota bacterium]